MKNLRIPHRILAQISAYEASAGSDEGLEGNRDRKRSDEEGNDVRAMETSN